MKIADEKAHLDQVRRFYAALAEGYDESIRRSPYYLNLYRQYDRCLADIFERRRNGHAFHTVVELGAGTGAHTLYLARRAERVVSLDLSADLLRINQAKLRAARIANVQLVQGDITAAGLRTATADGVICLGDVFSHVPRYETALAEMARITRPGGILCFDCDNKWCPQMLGDWDELRRAAATPAVGHLRTWHHHGHSMTFCTFSHKELRALLAHAGFQIEQTYGFNFLPSLIPERLHFTDRRTLGGKFCHALGRLDRHLTTHYPANRLAEAKLIIARRAANGHG
jgi:ubiquinone/menaquinone biosynthesis C-methylase UbiE